MDVHTPAQRSHNMSRVRGRDTKPEMLLRRGLHAAGLRYRVHVKDLPGRPDLVFPARCAVVQVQGCFWHGHDCPMFRLPATRPTFWAEKIAGNRARDARTRAALTAQGWRSLIIWECSLRGPARLPLAHVIGSVLAFLNGWEPEADLAGAWSAMVPSRRRTGRNTGEKPPP